MHGDVAGLGRAVHDDVAGLGRAVHDDVRYGKAGGSCLAWTSNTR